MNTIKTFLEWIASRLVERSSWLGLISIITAIGISLTPELQEVIIQLGLAIGGLVAFFTKDKATAKNK